MRAVAGRLLVIMANFGFTLAGIGFAIGHLRFEHMLRLGPAEVISIYVSCGALIGTILVLSLTISLIPIQRSAEFYTRSLTEMIMSNWAFSLAISLQIIFCLASFAFAMRGSRGFMLPVQFIVLAAALDSMRWHWRLTLRLIDSSDAARLLKERVRQLIEGGSRDEVSFDRVRLDAAELAERSVRRNETNNARDMIDVLKHVTVAWLTRFGPDTLTIKERTLLTAVGEDFERIAAIAIPMLATYTLDAVLAALAELRLELMRSKTFLMRNAAHEVIAPRFSWILSAAARQHMARPVIDAIPGVMTEPYDMSRPADVEAWERRSGYRNSAMVVFETCRALLQVNEIRSSNEALQHLMATLSANSSFSVEVYKDRLHSVLRSLDEIIPMAVSVPHIVPQSTLLDNEAKQLPLAAAYDISSPYCLSQLLMAASDHKECGPLFMTLAEEIGSHLMSLTFAPVLLGSGTFFLLRETSRDFVRALLNSAIALINADDERGTELYEMAGARATDLFPLILLGEEVKPDSIVLRQVRDLIDMMCFLAIEDLNRAVARIADSTTPTILSLFHLIREKSTRVDDQSLARVLALQKCAEADNRGRAPKSELRESIAEACREAFVNALPDEVVRDAALLQAERILSNAPERAYLREPVDALIAYRRYMAQSPSVPASGDPAEPPSLPPAAPDSSAATA